MQKGGKGECMGGSHGLEGNRVRQLTKNTRRIQTSDPILETDICDEGLKVLTNHLPMIRVEEVSFDQVVHVLVDLLISNYTKGDCLVGASDETVKRVPILEIR